MTDRPSFDAMDYAIRPLTTADEPILRETLYQALHTSEGGPPPKAVKRPEFARYVDGWGRPDDAGFVAHDRESGQLLGAVWMRRLSEQPTRHQISPLASNQVCAGAVSALRF